LLSDQGLDRTTVARDLAQAITIKHLLEDQIDILDKLRPLFECKSTRATMTSTNEVNEDAADDDDANDETAKHGDEQDGSDDEEYTKDIVEIPIIPPQERPQTRKMIGLVITQRKAVHARMLEFIGALREIVRRDKHCVWFYD
jgi:hypothetical protein